MRILKFEQLRLVFQAFLNLMNHRCENLVYSPLLKNTFNPL